MKKHNLFLTTTLSLLLSVGTISAQAPDGYYDSLDGKSGEELKNAVKEIGKKGFIAISYSSGTWEAFRTTDVRIVDGKECWWDMYSNNNVAVSSGHNGLNVEHSVANSWWGGTKNDAYKDIVHLNPSNSDANSRKSNFPLGEINGVAKWENGVSFVGSPVSGQGGGCTTVYEPHDMYKGDFARVFMYMFTIYDDISWQNATTTGDGRGRMYTYSGGKASLQPWAYNLMLAWSANDPVSEKEINRNNGIQKEQGNRNPFIDLPDLGDYLWGSKKNEVFHIEGSHIPEPVDPTDPIDPTDPDDPVPVNPDLEGKYILVENQADIKDGERYLIVAPKAGVALSINQGSNSTSILPSAAVTIKDGVIDDHPENAAMVTLEASGTKYRLHLSDANGKHVGYIASTKAKDAHIEDAANDGMTEAAVSVADGKASISFGSSNFLQYNASANMWRTYASGQEDPQLFRFISENVTSSVNTFPAERFRVIIYGNSIMAPEGSRIFNLNGHEISGENLSPGVYIVVSPERKQTVKAIITK